MTEKDFEISRLKDGTFRTTRLDVSGDLHTHTKSKKLAKTIIHNVVYGKIPLSTRNYTLISMMRLSTDDSYIETIKGLLDSRKKKGRKQSYYYARKKL